MKNDWIVIKNSKIHASGAFAKKDIPKGQYIIKYLGKKITNKEAERISEEEATQNIVFLFELNKRYTLDGNIPENMAKYVNHSCDPNAESVNDTGEIWMVSTKDIKKGEEVTYDYCLETDDYKEHPCNCGSQKCKKYLTLKNS